MKKSRLLEIIREELQEAGKSDSQISATHQSIRNKRQNSINSDLLSKDAKDELRSYLTASEFRMFFEYLDEINSRASTEAKDVINNFDIPFETLPEMCGYLIQYLSHMSINKYTTFISRILTTINDIYMSK